jgi:hypothetical protein
MYSEITVEHRETIGEEALKALIVESFKNSIDLGEAYDRTEVYQRRKPVSICAFESGPNCFVILRKVTDIRFSIYHFEGNHPTVTLPTMLEGVQEFVGELTALLNGKTVGPAYHPRKVTLRLFEDNANETGLVGTRANFWSVFKEKFALKELVPPVATFVTAALLLWRGLDKKPLTAALYSLLVVVFFKLVETLSSHFSKRARVEWKFSGSPSNAK